MHSTRSWQDSFDRLEQSRREEQRMREAEERAIRLAEAAYARASLEVVSADLSRPVEASGFMLTDKQDDQAEVLVTAKVPATKPRVRKRAAPRRKANGAKARAAKPKATKRRAKKPDAAKLAKPLVAAANQPQSRAPEKPISLTLEPLAKNLHRQKSSPTGGGGMSEANAGGGQSAKIATSPPPLRQPLQGCHLPRKGRIETEMAHGAFTSPQPATPSPATTPVISLPRQRQADAAEPLLITPLPRSASLARYNKRGLFGLIGSWLRLATRRPRLPESLRRPARKDGSPRDDLAALRSENKWLRRELEALKALQEVHRAETPPWATDRVTTPAEDAPARPRRRDGILR